MLYSPGPIIFDLGNLLHLPLSLPLRWYGLMTGLGFIMAIFIIQRLAKNKLNEAQKQGLMDMLFWSFIGGIIGARLWFVLLSLNYFAKDPIEVFYIWQGGQSIQGGFIGGFLTAYLYYKFKAQKLQLPFLQTYDWAALALPVGQAIGRWGNFFNTEAFGKPTNLAWGLFVPTSLRPVGYATSQSFHPTFAYESFYLLLVALFLWACNKNLNLKPGVSFCLYLILYSVGRFFLEFLRLDSLLIGPFAAAQVICVVTIVLAACFCIFLYKQTD
jgi:phosphatidylglycerol---prolipoprotein diacylglyceryl transferase